MSDPSTLSDAGLALLLFAIGYAVRMLQDKRRPYWKAPQTPEEWRRLHPPDLPPPTYDSPIAAEFHAGVNRKIREEIRLAINAHKEKNTQ